MPNPTTPHSHLKPEVIEALDYTPNERKAYIRRGFWVPYPAAQDIIEKLEALLEHPHQGRVPGMSIVAHTNNGKSSTIEQFIAGNPPDDADEWEGLHRPIVHATAPKDCDLRVLFEKILQAMGVAINRGEREPVLRSLVFHHLERNDARMLVLDEFHNALAGSATKQPSYLNQIKEFCVDLYLPVVVAGNEKLPLLLRHVEELSNRLEPEVLPRWSPNEDLQKLLKGIEQRLPFPQPSMLSTPDMAGYFFERSGGLAGGALLGEMMRLIQLAACAAINANEPNITLARLDAVKRPPPEDRWAAAQSALAPLAPTRQPTV